MQLWDRDGTVLKILRYNRKVAGSIPDGVIRIFHSHNPFNRTMALGSTQPLTEMSTRGLPGGKGGRCVGLTTLPPYCAIVMKSGNFNFLEPSGLLQACNGTALPFLCNYIWFIKETVSKHYVPATITLIKISEHKYYVTALHTSVLFPSGSCTIQLFPHTVARS
jgi:hypothetical protein